MKIQTQKKVMLAALSKVQGVANAKSTMPILSNVLIKADGEGCTISASDLQVHAAVTFKADVEPGEITVGASALFAIVKNAREGDMVIELVDDSLRIKAGAGRFRLPTAPTKDFPKFPKSDGAVQVVPGAALAEVLAAVQHAALQDFERPLLNTVQISASGGVLSAAATNGSRAARIRVKAEGCEDFSVIVPLPGVGQLRTLAAAGDVSIEVTAAHLFAWAGDLALAIKLGEQKKTPIDSVVSSSEKSSTNRLVFDRGDMLDALRRVDVVADSAVASQVKMLVVDCAATISAATPDAGEGSDTVTTDYAGEPLEVSFSPRLLADALGVMVDDEVTIALGGVLDPILVTSSSVDFVALVMPMREVSR